MAVKNKKKGRSSPSKKERPFFFTLIALVSTRRIQDNRLPFSPSSSSMHPGA